MIYIFDWLGDFIGGIGSAIGGVFDYLGEQISNAIWNTMLQWLYETIYNAVADFFTMMGNMGADVFDLEWVQATINPLYDAIADREPLQLSLNVPLISFCLKIILNAKLRKISILFVPLQTEVLYKI